MAGPLNQTNICLDGCKRSLGMETALIAKEDVIFHGYLRRSPVDESGDVKGLNGNAMAKLRVHRLWCAYKEFPPEPICL